MQMSPRPTLGPSESMIRPATPVTVPTRCAAGAWRTCERRTSTSGPTVTALMCVPLWRQRHVLRDIGRRRDCGPAPCCRKEESGGRMAAAKAACPERTHLPFDFRRSTFDFSSLAREAVREHGEFGFLAGVGETEAA